MDSSDPLGESLAALTRFFVGDHRLDQTVQRVVELAAQAVPTASMTGITMLVEDQARTAFLSEPEVTDLDQAQYDEGDGPCLHAFRSGETIRIDSLEDDDRWPNFAKRGVEHGIHSTLSLPLTAGDRPPVGALNFYSERVGGFTGDEETTAELFASQAATVLANAHAYWDSYDLAQRMHESQDARAIIEQAKGIIMATSHVDADSAFALLVRASQRENRKVRDMAADLVARRTPPEDG